MVTATQSDVGWPINVMSLKDIEVALNKLIQTVRGIDSAGVGENAEVIHGRVKVPEPSRYLIPQDEATRRVDLVPDGLTIVYTVYAASEGSLPVISGVAWNCTKRTFLYW